MRNLYVWAIRMVVLSILLLLALAVGLLVMSLAADVAGAVEAEDCVAVGGEQQPGGTIVCGPLAACEYYEPRTYIVENEVVEWPGGVYVPSGFAEADCVAPGWEQRAFTPSTPPPPTLPDTAMQP